MHSMYIKIFLMNLKPELCLSKEGNFTLQCKHQQAKCLIFGAHYKVTNTSLHLCVPHTECMYVVLPTSILHYEEFILSTVAKYNKINKKKF